MRCVFSYVIDIIVVCAHASRSYSTDKSGSVLTILSKGGRGTGMMANYVALTYGRQWCTSVVTKKWQGALPTACEIQVVDREPT